jgi:F-type H+-transporting ATPase subunit beta
MPNAGKIAQIIGPVVDVSFTENAHLPKIYDALEIVKDNGQKIILEVQQHLGEDEFALSRWTQQTDLFVG